MVFRRDHSDRKRPGNAQPRIIIAQPAFGPQGIELADLIACFRVIPQYLVSVGKAFRHEQSPLIVFGQFHGNVLEVGGAFRPEVHDHIQNSSARAAHVLGLRRGRELEMHAAQCASLQIESHVRLGDHGLEALRQELFLAKRPGEETAPIQPALKIDEVSAFKSCFRE